MANDKTLLGVLVVILVVIGAVMVLIPFRARVSTHPPGLRTMNHLRRIVEAQIGYSSDAGTWAYPSGFTIPDGSDPEAVVEYVGRCFVVLAKYNELSPKLFTSRHSPVKPSRDHEVGRLRYVEILGHEDAATSVHALDRDEALRWAASFAYDYSSPGNSAAERPIIGERSPEMRWNKGACVAYGDGHARLIEASSTKGMAVPQAETLTVGEELSLVVQIDWNVRSTEGAMDDWIYNYDAHLGAYRRWAVGRGSSTLAWLR